MRGSTARAMMVGVAALACATSACKKECEFNGDCPSPSKCISNSCQPQPNPGPREMPDASVLDADSGSPSPDADSGPDSGPDADAGFRPDATDVGTRDATDGGGAPEGDVGVFAGCADAGVSTSDASTVPSGGSLLYGEYVGAQMMSFVRTYAEFYDRTGTSYVVVNQRFPDELGGSCTLTVTRPVGMPRGLTAQSIQLTSRGLGPTLMRQLDPVPGTPGRFEPATMFMPGFLAGQTDVYVAVRALSPPVPNTLGNFSADPLQTPSYFGGSNVTPAAGSQVALLQSAVFSWTPTPGANDLTRLEIYDARREDVLLCSLRDTGMYVIPQAAVRAWYAACPMAPASLEIRYETNARGTVPVISGSTPTVPMDIKVARGVQYSVQ